jgi:glutamyl-tRNA reductase
MQDELIYLGITHRTAPLCVREACCADRTTAGTMYTRLASRAPGRLILSTCERFEMYLTAREGSVPDVQKQLSHWFHIPLDVLHGHVQVRTGEDAARHLLCVAAGLDSRIVGETHILGQFRKSYVHALEVLALDPTLAALGRFALRAGKRARCEAGINATRESIATITVDRLQRTSRARAATDVLVLGSGEIASEILARLAACPARPFRTLLSARNHERAIEMAERSGASVVPWSEILTAVARADAVVACTAAMTFILDAAAVAGTMNSRRHRPLLTIDLGMPRNIDPACARIANVTTLDLTGISPASTSDQVAVQAARQIVEQELEAFARWRRERIAAPIISAMFERERLDRNYIPLNTRRRLHPYIVRLKAEAAA